MLRPGLIVALVALGFLGWNQAQLKLVGITAGEAELARARKKYRQVIVDIEELPEAKPNNTIIHFKLFGRFGKNRR